MKTLAVYIACAGTLFASCAEFQSKRIELGAREWKGMGYETGYESARIFLAPSWTKPFSPFLDARAHILNDGRFASNFGLGARCALNSNWATGINAYYDFRDAKHLQTNQLGLGTELLSPWFDVRFNGYMPLNSSFNKRAVRFDYFQNNNLFVKQSITAALPHVDGEVGLPIPGPARVIDLYFGIGSYYLFKNGTIGNAWGGKTRLEAKLWDGLLAGISFTYDEIYHGRVQGYLNLSVPFGPSNMRTQGSRWKELYGQCDQLAKERMRLTQPVIRDEIIPTKNKTNHFIAIDPDTQGPFRFIFVNNTSNSLGTFESPYPTLALAQANSIQGDVIYVYPGDGTTNGYNAGITLKNDQILVSSAIPFNLKGVVTLPEMTTVRPTITNLAQTGGVILAQGNTVAGMIIENAGLGIFGVGVQKYTLLNNIIRNNNNSGVVLNLAPNISNVRGVIRENYFTNNDLGPSNNEVFCAFSDNSVINVARNQFIGVHLNAIPFLFFANGTSRGVFRENFVSQSATLSAGGFTAGTVPGTTYYEFLRNVGIGNGFGVNVTATAGQTRAFIANNRVANTVNLDCVVRAETGAKSIAVTKGNISHGGIVNAGIFASSDAGQVCVEQFVNNFNTQPYIVDNLTGNPTLVQITSQNAQVSGVASINSPSTFSIGATDAVFVLPGTSCP
ncbi:MAG: inverse autotransporter beta domain-containing protein [Chlamydiales bacterium]|nr:inverse autotransporter beta domain-containing protein [Chlamydiales bacterium]